MTAIQVIAFDLDDTLWDNRPIILRAERMLADWLADNVPGLGYDTESLRALRAQVLEESPELAGKVTELRRQVIRRALLASGVESDRAARLADAGMDVFLEARNQIELFDGALATLEHLAERYVLGALTNGNADIRRLGLEQVFSFAFSAEDVGAPKPAPRLFEAAIAHTEVEPHQMVYVGDHPELDVDAANRAGLRTIWVRASDARAPGETRADIVVTHVNEIPDRLVSLL